MTGLCSNREISPMANITRVSLLSTHQIFTPAMPLVMFTHSQQVSRGEEYNLSMFKWLKLTTEPPRHLPSYIYPSCHPLITGQSWLRTSSKAPIVSLGKKLFPRCLITSWFQEQIQAWFHIQTKENWGSLMEDWLKCQINPLA